jgi:chromatin assembly factor 1 subunit B
LEVDNKVINTSYIFTCNNYTKPAVYIPHDRPSTAISVNPLKYELNKMNESGDVDTFALPYRFVFAVATEDSVYLYDTQCLTPFAFIAGIHYSNISDLSWSSNGNVLILTSIDGFCTFVVFENGELGEVYNEPPPLPSQQKENVESTEDKTEIINIMADVNLNHFLYYSTFI